MAFMAAAFLRKLFSRQNVSPGETRSGTSTLDRPTDWLINAFLGDLSAMAGVNVTPLKAMGVATVYAVVTTTANAIASIPLTLIKKDGRNRLEATDHPLYDLITCACNDFMTSADFLTAMEANRTLRGNCYAQIVRNGRGEIIELIPLHPTSVSWRMENNIPRYHVNGDALHFQDVLHIKNFTDTGLVGASPISHIRDVIGLAIALQDNASKFFANGSKVADVLATDQKMSPDQINDLKTQLKRRKEKGEEYSTMVLDNGLKYVAYRSENRDSQFMEARRLQRQEIAAAFGIPASKVGILDNATYSNIEQLGIDFVVSYLQPICVRWEKALNQRLLSPDERRAGFYFKFKLQGLMRGDAATRAGFYHNMILDGVLTRNEVREFEDLNPLAGLDAPFIPLNMADGSLPKSADPALKPEFNSPHKFYVERKPNYANGTRTERPIHRY